jgi:hypothetical protein
MTPIDATQCHTMQDGSWLGCATKGSSAKANDAKGKRTINHERAYLVTWVAHRAVAAFVTPSVIPSRTVLLMSPFMSAQASCFSAMSFCCRTMSSSRSSIWFVYSRS